MSGASCRQPVSSSFSPRSQDIEFLAVVLRELGYEPKHWPNGFVEFERFDPSFHSVMLDDSPYLTLEDIIDSIVRQGVDLHAVRRVIEKLQ